MALAKRSLFIFVQNLQSMDAGELWRFRKKLKRTKTYEGQLLTEKEWKVLDAAMQKRAFALIGELTRRKGVKIRIWHFI